jgi:hypothetical protein
MLKILSAHFNRSPPPARRTRNAIFDIYATLLERLGSNYVEARYAEILEHFIVEVVDQARNQTISHEAATVREMVGLVLREVIAVRSLSEQGQGMAVREIADKYMKKWPAVLPGATEPSEMVLLVILRELAELLRQLGTAAPVIQDAVQEPLLRLLSHPRESVRLHSAWCLRVYCSTTPLRLPKVLNALVEALDKDIALMGNPSAPADLSARANGKATAIGALMAVIPDRPLYVSHDISTRVLDTAVQLLKRSGEHDFKVAEVEVHVAWTLMSGLMTLGPTFVASHLPQLLGLWRNSLPKPTSKDTSVGERGEKEWAFLLDVREYTLSAILTFLQNNKELTTLDVARRLASLLTNTLNFVNGFATAYSDYLREQQQNPNVPVGATRSAMTLATREHELRRRVLQCFGTLGNSSATEGVQPALVQAAVGILADPDVSGLPGTQPQTTNHAAIGPFTDVWSTSDGYGFGICSADATAGQREAFTRKETLNRDLVEQRLQNLVRLEFACSAMDRDLNHFPLLSAAHQAGPSNARERPVVRLISIFERHQRNDDGCSRRHRRSRRRARAVRGLAHSSKLRDVDASDNADDKSPEKSQARPESRQETGGPLQYHHVAEVRPGSPESLGTTCPILAFSSICGHSCKMLSLTGKSRYERLRVPLSAASSE